MRRFAEKTSEKPEKTVFWHFFQKKVIFWVFFFD